MEHMPIPFFAIALGAAGLIVAIAFAALFVVAVRDDIDSAAEHERHVSNDEDAAAWQRFDEGVVRALQSSWSELP